MPVHIMCNKQIYTCTYLPSSMWNFQRNTVSNPWNTINISAALFHGLIHSYLLRESVFQLSNFFFFTAQLRWQLFESCFAKLGWYDKAPIGWSCLQDTKKWRPKQYCNFLILLKSLLCLHQTVVYANTRQIFHFLNWNSSSYHYISGANVK